MPETCKGFLMKWFLACGKADKINKQAITTAIKRFSSRRTQTVISHSPSRDEEEDSRYGYSAPMGARGVKLGMNPYLPEKDQAKPVKNVYKCQNV